MTLPKSMLLSLVIFGVAVALLIILWLAGVGSASNDTLSILLYVAVLLFSIIPLVIFAAVYYYAGSLLWAVVITLILATGAFFSLQSLIGAFIGDFIKSIF